MTSHSPASSPDLPKLPESTWHPAPHERAFSPGQVQAYATAYGLACYEAGRASHAAPTVPVDAVVGEPVAATMQETCVGADIRIHGVHMPTFNIGTDANPARRAFVDAVNAAARAQGAGEAVAQWQYRLNNSYDLPWVNCTEREARDLIEVHGRVYIIRALYAAPTIQQAAEVPGFVLVPRELTDDMVIAALDAACFKVTGQSIKDMRAAYIAALAAAPTPTASAPKAEGCQHRIADARNPVVKDGYFCVDCGALFRAADHEPPSEADRTREGGDVDSEGAKS